MPRYIKLGSVPRKRHTQFRKPDGSLYSEQVFGTKGFSGIAAGALAPGFAGAATGAERSTKTRITGFRRVIMYAAYRNLWM